MSDLEENQSLPEVQDIQELLKRKAELEELNSNLATRVQDDTEKIKIALKEARKDGQKLLHHRDKLKSHANKHVQGKHGVEVIKQNELKRMEKEDSNENKAEKVSKPQTNRKGEDDISEDNLVQIQRQLNALRLENTSLVREKRKTEEHNASLVQELADLGMKHENLQALCDRLEEEIARLSACLGMKSSSAENGSVNENEEDIEMLKQQVRLYQEEINGMQAQIEISQRSKERLRVELSEARAVIRNLRQMQTFEFYPAPVYQLGRYRSYEDRYGFDRDEFRMARPASRGFINPMRKNSRHPRHEPLKKNLFMPDFTAVTDKEVKDSSLVSSKSF